jgi:hypothetical protein
MVDNSKYKSILRHPTQHTSHTLCGQDPLSPHKNKMDVCMHNPYRSLTIIILISHFCNFYAYQLFIYFRILCKRSNTGSVIPRLTCWGYIPLFLNFLRMAPQCQICRCFNTCCDCILCSAYVGWCINFVRKYPTLICFTFINPEQRILNPLVPCMSSQILTLGWFY